MLSKTKKFFLPVIKEVQPIYGFYGGAGRGMADCKEPPCRLPIDWMDAAFKKHDERVLSDSALVIALKKGNPEELYAVKFRQPISQQLYARWYRHAAINFFSAGQIFKPK